MSHRYVAPSSLKEPLSRLSSLWLFGKFWVFLYRAMRLKWLNRKTFWFCPKYLPGFPLVVGFFSYCFHASKSVVYVCLFWANLLNLFSLIAMSTLYVLDWHSRTFGYHRRQTAVIATTASPEKAGNIGNIIQVNKDLWIPPSQPKAPPLAGVCERKQCQTYCCADRHKYDVHDDNKEVCAFSH